MESANALLDQLVALESKISSINSRRRAEGKDLVPYSFAGNLDVSRRLINKSSDDEIMIHYIPLIQSQLAKARAALATVHDYDQDPNVYSFVVLGAAALAILYLSS